MNICVDGRMFFKFFAIQKKKKNSKLQTTTTTAKIAFNLSNVNVFLVLWKKGAKKYKTKSKCC